MMDEIVQSIHDHFDSLPKSGKPKDNEWTCLAAFVMETNNVRTLVSLATGTKCIGANVMDEGGRVVNDSHAEVLARRNLLRYLYDQLRKASGNHRDSIFTKIGTQYVLQNGIKFHFYCSQVPCGDASIIPMESWQPDVGSKRKLHDPNNECTPKRFKNDVHRTGAKPLLSETKQDPKNTGGGYHIRGAVRTKPGRGDPTKSLSCSDKVAKWLYCGLQGALLSLLIQLPIELATIIIGGCGPFDPEVLEQAIIRRSGHTKSPALVRSSLVFKHSPHTPGAIRPCATSIHWAEVSENKLQVSVEGRPLGVTKTSKTKPYLLTSKYALFTCFLQLADECSLYGKSYNAVKRLAAEYEMKKEQFIAAMGFWSEDKSEYEMFSIVRQTSANFSS